MIKLLELVPTELQDKYGKVFMGQVPSFVQRQKSEEEADTEHEKVLVRKLSAWQQAGDVGTLDRIMHDLKEYIPELKKIADENKWLKLVPRDVIFRGTSFTKEAGKDLWEKVLLNGQIIKSGTTSVTYKPKRQLMASWSHSDVIATSFCTGQLKSMRQALRDATSHIQDNYDINIRGIVYLMIEMCCMDGKYSRERLIEHINSNKLTSYTEESFEKTFGNLEQVVFDEVLYMLDYQFPVTLIYEVTASDYCLFPGNLFTDLMKHARSNLANNEFEILFLDVPSNMHCTLLLPNDEYNPYE